MRAPGWAVLALLTPLISLPLDAVAQPLTVHVAAIKSPLQGKPSEEEREQASAAYKAADSARKDLEKALKAKYGNKRNKWPAEAQEQMAAAEEARNAVNTAYLYRVDAEPVEDFWRAAIEKALTQSGNTGRKEHVTPARSQDEAHLLVTLVGVRNPGAARKAADDRCLAVRLTHGPRLSPERFASIPQTWRPRRSKTVRLAPPSDASPFWLFEGCGLHPYFSPEESVATIVNDFAGDHRDLLIGKAGATASAGPGR